MSSEEDREDEIEKIREASQTDLSYLEKFCGFLPDSDGLTGSIRNLSKGPGNWLKEILFDRKALPVYLLLAALYVSSFRSPNFLFRDGVFNEQILAGKLQFFISVVNESFILGSPVKVTTTALLVGMIWSTYLFWLKDLKLLEKSYGLLKRILTVLIAVILLYRHVRQGSVLEQFSKWIIFALVLYLELAATWFSMKTLDYIDLSSDLKNWSLRLLGLPTVFTGSLISIAAQPLITFSYTPAIYGNNVFLAGLLVMILGGFMIYRSTRRQPALKIW